LRTASQRVGLVLWVWADSRDDLRQQILLRRGFTRVADAIEHQWRRDLALPIPDTLVAPGYTVRSLGGVNELPARNWALWKAFHPDEPDEQYQDWGGYLNIQSAPLYRRDLDMVAATAKSEIVAFTTIWYDDAARSAYFEPVGTVPAHQRRGLGKAVMTEGLRRLKQMGATRALVIGGEPPANALYQSVMGLEYDLSEPWEKRW
jgi:GNAT superfamily N-acetyltransferase